MWTEHNMVGSTEIVRVISNPEYSIFYSHESFSWRTRKLCIDCSTVHILDNPRNFCRLTIQRGGIDRPAALFDIPCGELFMVFDSIGIAGASTIGRLHFSSPRDLTSFSKAGRTHRD